VVEWGGYMGGRGKGIGERGQMVWRKSGCVGGERHGDGTDVEEGVSADANTGDGT